MDHRRGHEVVGIRAREMIGKGVWEKEASDKLGTQKCGTVKRTYDGDFLEPPRKEFQQG